MVLKYPKNMPFARYCQIISIKRLSKYAPYTVQILGKLDDNVELHKRKQMSKEWMLWQKSLIYELNKNS